MKRATLAGHAGPASVDAGMAAEGDINLSPLRREWDATHVGPATRSLLDEDARFFLHQSLSTPCFDALVGAEGIYLVDTEGRRFMDFHGNSVHQVGYRHPKVIAAVKRQLDTLPFSPRRFTNATAVELARRLVALAPAPWARSCSRRAARRRSGWRSSWRGSRRAGTRRFRCGTRFHGASLDAISIGGEAAFRKNIGPLLPGTEHVPPCDPGHCPYRCGGRCSLALRRLCRVRARQGTGCRRGHRRDHTLDRCADSAARVLPDAAARLRSPRRAAHPG